MDNLFGDDTEMVTDDDAPEIDDAEDIVDAVDLSPRENPELVGHEAAERALLADYNAGRMPHALVIGGPAGVGKATLAFRLARFLLSQEDEGAGLFGAPAAPDTLALGADHPVFRRVVSGGHADLLTVEREMDEKKGRLKNDISVESVRRIAPFLRKTAAEGGWRVVIVDGAEYLNASSQNALLKVLEEPPARALLILVTAQPGALLPTIRSRCRMVHLDPLPDHVLAAFLSRRLPRLDPAARTALVQCAGGSPGRALARQRDGSAALGAELLKAVSALPKLDLVQAHDIADRVGRAGAEAEFEATREFMTDLCAARLTDSARNGAETTRVFLETWEKMTRLFDQAESYNLDKRQAVLHAFLLLQNPSHQGPSI